MSFAELDTPRLSQLDRAEALIRSMPYFTCRDLIIKVHSNYPNTLIKYLKDKRRMNIVRETKRREGENFYRYYLEAK